MNKIIWETFLTREVASLMYPLLLKPVLLMQYGTLKRLQFIVLFRMKTFEFMFLQFLFTIIMSSSWLNIVNLKSMRKLFKIHICMVNKMSLS